MRILGASRSSVVVASAVLAVSGLTLCAGATAAPQSVRVPAATKTLSYLVGISVVPHSATAWAFGLHGTATHETPYAIVGSGKHWRSVAVHAPAGAALKGIAAASATSIWIVGSLFKGGKTYPVIEHSTGGAFKAVKVPQLGRGGLTGVSASAANNVWAYGTNDNSVGDGLLDRFSGKKWEKQSLGTDNEGLTFTGITTTSPKNTWIAAVNPSSNTPFVDYWNGQVFSLYVTAAKDATATITSIAATSAKNVWIAGYRPETVKGTVEQVAVSERLHGTSLVDVPMPSPGTGAYPASVAATGSKVYVAGQSLTKTNATVPLAETFNGTKWRNQHTVTGGQQSLFASVSASSKAVVAAGTFNYPGTGFGGSSLVEQLTGSSWHRLKVPS